MPGGKLGRTEPLWRVEFRRRKYGPELLVDAAMLSKLPAFKATAKPHALSFYDILLVTKGRGSFELDGERLEVAPGALFFTAPGQIRRWRVDGLDGACVFFAADISDAFADARFFDQFAFFNRRRPSGGVTLTVTERTQFLRRFRRMSEELASPRADATDVLRARLYELLVLLNRWYRARHPMAIDAARHPAVAKFQAMVERDFRRQHRVQEYARRIGVSPGHLNVLCHRHLGWPAGAAIRQRLLLEAKRLLRYSDKPAFVVAGELGFADAAYFGRFFRRETGATPRTYRNRG
jgi:AraC family transcriptional activator of pobA